MIVGAEAFSCTEISGLSRRSHSAGKPPADLDVDPTEEQAISPMGSDVRV
jgi:hypothetical protein